MSRSPARAGLAPTRRTVVKGGAWLAPAIVVGAAAPAFAVSGSLVMPSVNGTPCSYPGVTTPWARSFRAPVCFTSTHGLLVDVSITGLTWRGAAPVFAPPGSPQPGTLFFDPQLCLDDGADGGDVADTCAVMSTNYNFSLAPGASLCRWLFWRGDDASTGQLCFSYNYDDGNGTVSTTTCLTLATTTNCGCTTPQPPYTPDTAESCDPQCLDNCREAIESAQSSSRQRSPRGRTPLHR